MRADVIVIGGGVIGLASANALLDAGRSVRILERDELGAGASHGNCGLITPSHALPLTRPGMMRKIVGWMWSADAPVWVRPRLDLGFLAWSLRFARSCRRETMLAIMRDREVILSASREMYDDWLGRDGIACEWETNGLLDVFATEAAMDEASPTHRMLEDLGVRSDALDRAQLIEREPALRDDLFGARWWTGDAQLRPEQLVEELGRVVRAKGAEVEEGCAVNAIEVDGGRVTAVATGRGSFEADHVVLATGAWSPELGRTMGIRIPVQPGKGYSVTAKRPDPCPRYPLLLHEANLAATPWPSGYRLAGTMEFSGYDEKLRRSRVEALGRAAQRFLRHPPIEVHEEWFGYRPMTPDELPIIDRVPKLENAFLATGHGMMGVSMAPATGRLVAELVTGAKPFLDVEPYRLGRF